MGVFPDVEIDDALRAMVAGAWAGDERSWVLLVDRFDRLVWSVVRHSVAAFAVVVTVIVFIGRQPRVKVASCGKCRYAVEGLTVMTCPECGSDLREVGILTPSGRKRLGPAIWITLWTLVLPVPVMIINTLIVGAIPLNWSTSLTIQVQSKLPGYTGASVRLTGEGVHDSDIYQFAAISLQRDWQWLGEP